MLYTGACWFNVQHAATDEFILDMAAELRDSLDPKIDIYLEDSNEMFNPEVANGEYQCPQYRWVRNKGLAERLDTDEVAAGRKQMARSAANEFAIFSDVFGSAKKKRLKFDVGGWIAINTYTRDMLTYFHDPAYNPTGVKAGHLAIAASVGFSNLNPFHATGEVQSFTADDIIDHMESSIDQRFPDEWDPGTEEESVRKGLQVARGFPS